MNRKDIHSIKQSGVPFFPKTVADAVYVEEYQKTLTEVLRDIEKGELGLEALIEVLSKHFLSKVHKDTSNELITFIQGLRSKEMSIFEKGIKDTAVSNQTGWSIAYDADGNSLMNIDKLNVRLEAVFRELIIEKYSSVSGGRISSCASMKCVNVELTESSYICYFDSGDSGEVVNQFEADDQAICQVFSGSKLKYYWRLVLDVGKDFIILSRLDSDGSGIPEVGDEIIQLGNRSESSRQNAIIEKTYGNPSYVQYKGINSFTLNGRDKTVLSPTGNKFTGSFVFESTGGNLEDELNKRNKYTIHLTNEMASVACRIDGSPYGELPTTEVQIYLGTSEDNTWNISLLCKGCTASVKSNLVSVTSLIEDNATITVVASKTGESSIKKDMSISKVRDGEVGDKGEDSITVNIFSSSGNLTINNDIDIFLTAQVVKGNYNDITDTIPPNLFSWTRTGIDPENDTIWNSLHVGTGKSIRIGDSDMVRKALFGCEVNYQEFLQQQKL